DPEAHEDAKRGLEKKPKAKAKPETKPETKPKTPKAKTPPPSVSTPTTEETSGMVAKLYTGLDVITEWTEEVEARIGEVRASERTELRQRAEAAVEQLKILIAALTPTAT